MAKLDRVQAKIFADLAPESDVSQFGSFVAGAKLPTTDIATIQGISAWLDGFSEALVSGNRYPSLQELNGLLKVLSYQGAYALQEGIAEYNADTTYYIGSIVKKTGTFEIYGSLTDDNVGNALTVDTEWNFLCDLNEIADIDLSNITTTGKSIIANLAMPSDTYIAVTLLASGNSYTAIKDGYLQLKMTATGLGQYMELINNASNYSDIDSPAGSAVSGTVTMPCKSGDTITYNYSTPTPVYFRFYYAEGSKP